MSIIFGMLWCGIGALSLHFWWRRCFSVLRFGAGDRIWPIVLGPVDYLIGYLVFGKPAGYNFWGRKL